MLVLYVLILIWLILFKLTFHPSSILEYHRRSLNLVPFTSHLGEMVLNFIFFIPFGLLLPLNFKKATFVRNLVVIFLFSFTAELLQYLFAIGASDITDVITNTSGGLLGLILYAVARRFVSTEKLDRMIIVAGAVLLVLFLGLHLGHLARM